MIKKRNNILEELENVLFSEAETCTPNGSEPKAVIHQWIHAIAHDLPLFGEVNRATEGNRSFALNV